MVILRKVMIKVTMCFADRQLPGQLQYKLYMHTFTKIQLFKYSKTLSLQPVKKYNGLLYGWLFF